MSDITDLRSLIMSHFDNRETKQLRKPFNSFISDYYISYEQKLDLLGELTIKDSEYFMETIYPGIDNRLKNTTIPGLIKRDEHMLMKYCFLEGEDIKTTFIGTIMDKKTTTSGRIHLTNYRILACGVQMTRSAQNPVFRTGIVETLIRSGISHHRKAIRKAITNAFRKDLAEWNLGEWGYYFPIYNAKNIKRGNKSVSYAIDVETEKKPITLKITITPTRVRKQPKYQFQEQREDVLNQVEELLKQYQ